MLGSWHDVTEDTLSLDFGIVQAQVRVLPAPKLVAADSSLVVDLLGGPVSVPQLSIDGFR